MEDNTEGYLVYYSVYPSDSYGYSYPYERVVLSKDNKKLCVFEKMPFLAYIESINGIDCVVYTYSSFYTVVVYKNLTELSRKVFDKENKSDSFIWGYLEMLKYGKTEDA